MNLLATLLPVAQDEPFVRDPADSGTSCVAENDTVCIGWALDNIDRYVTPTLEHLELVVLSVGFGFVLAFAMALFSHGRRWLVPTFTGATGVIYTLPSIALFEYELDGARERVEHIRQHDRAHTGLTWRHGTMTRCAATSRKSNAIAMRIAIPPAMATLVLNVMSA